MTTEEQKTGIEFEKIDFSNLSSDLAENQEPPADLLTPPQEEIPEAELVADTTPARVWYLTLYKFSRTDKKPYALGDVSETPEESEAETRKYVTNPEAVFKTFKIEWK